MYPWHRFDLFFTIIGWIGLACDGLTPFHLTAPVVILRAFRLANVLTMSSRSTFTDVMTTAFTIMPRMIRFGGALFCSCVVDLNPALQTWAGGGDGGRRQGWCVCVCVCVVVVVVVVVCVCVCGGGSRY
jgi:hypothetical protein